MGKRILITVSKDAMRRNILEGDFTDVLLSNPEIDIYLIVDADKRDNYEKQFISERIHVVGYERVLHTGFGKVLNFLLRTGVNSHSMRTYRNRAFARGKASRMSHYTKAFISNTLGRSAFFARVLRSLYLKTKAPKGVLEILDECSPDIVFSLSGIDKDFDAEFCKAAKQRGTKLVGMVRSWDNLNNHGVLPVVPDIFFFQNSFLTEMASSIQGLVLTKISSKLVGLPHYDTYYEAAKLTLCREDFIGKSGLDPSKKLIVFGGSDFYYSEDIIPKLLNNAVEQGLFADSVQIVFRPHPSRLFPLEAYRLDELEHVTLNDAFSGLINFTDTDFFLNLLYHADVIVNTASTLSIDAAVLDKPAVCINFDDSNRKLTHYESVHRLYDHFDHYERLVATGGVRTPDTKEKLIADINEYLTDPSLDREGRKKIVDTFVAPFDGRSGERLALELLKELE